MALPALHDPIEKITENLWRVEGPTSNPALRRVMTVARLADGRLVIHSAIALREEAMKELEAWGTPAFLLVPNRFHRMDIRAYQDRYPSARVLCPRAARAAVEKVARVSGTYEDFPEDPSVSLEYLDGVAHREGVMRVASADGHTLVFNDVLFNMPHAPGLQGFLVKAVGSSGGPRVTRIARLFLVKDKRALASHLERLAAIRDLRRIIVSHHVPIDQAPAETLRAVAATLRR